MSVRAKVAGWVAAFLVLGGWAWHHGRVDGQVVAVVFGLLAAALVLAVLEATSSDLDLDRAADPRPYNGERP